MTLIWAVAQLVITPLFLIGGSWRFVCIAFIGVPLIGSLFVTWKYIFETPRFLYSRHKFAEAKENINKVCKINRKPRFTAKLIGEVTGEDITEEATFFQRRKVRPSTEMHAINISEISGYIDLLKNPELRKITLALLYIWFFRNYTYYGLNLTLPALGTEVYQYFTYTAFAEIFANLLATRIKLRFGRKLIMMGTTGLVGLSCLAIIFFPILEDCLMGFCYQKVAAVAFAIVRMLTKCF
jgi:hypothetical protein